VFPVSVRYCSGVFLFVSFLLLLVVVVLSSLVCAVLFRSQAAAFSFVRACSCFSALTATPFCAVPLCGIHSPEVMDKASISTAQQLYTIVVYGFTLQYFVYLTFFLRKSRFLLWSAMQSDSSAAD
jgi:predicted permease